MEEKGGWVECRRQICSKPEIYLRKMFSRGLGLAQPVQGVADRSENLGPALELKAERER